MTTFNQRQLHLGLMFWATGTHSAGWRHPLAKTDGAFNIRFIQDVCKTVEAAKFDFIFLGDRLVADPALAKTNPGQMVRLEPFVVASAIAAATERVGIVVTTNTTYSDPFTVARMLASLDHVSHGRASWNIVTGADVAAAKNFSRDAHWTTDARYDWADAFAASVHEIWDSWRERALHREAHDLHIDRRAIDAVQVERAPIQFSGPGPLPRSPQRYPVILHAGTSERSRDLAAKYADVVFTGDARIEASQAYYRDIKARAHAYGRNPHDIKIVPGLVVIVEETTEQAIDVHDTLNRLILLDPEDTSIEPDGKGDTSGGTQPNFQYVGMGRGALRNLSLASDAFGVDLRGHSHHDPVDPALFDQTHEQGREILAYITRLTRRTLDAREPARRITYLDLIHASIAQTSAVVGNPQEVADYMQRWLDEEAADGFNIFPPFLPYSVDRFCDLVVPELQRRGIYRHDYASPLLRDHFGLTPGTHGSTRRPAHSSEEA
jgi:FMN-dependent oxidoreductase (nitrilotriacetate monooxygenase family)